VRLVAKRSAGILLFRRTPAVQVLLAHPGGPLHAHKDVWTVPKGEYDDEPPLTAAYREFVEELGHPVPQGPALDLGEVVQKGGKRVVAWAVEGDLDPGTCVSNTFGMTWQGRWQEFPEIDRVEWFDLEAARTKINPAQVAFLDRLGALAPDL
jgi:predicted NUDIX family NTP pyrophosphohydrolase